MMELKAYQSATLDVLRRFLEEARVLGAASAYTAITSEPAQAKRLRGYGGQYVPLNSDPATPYVALRLPTGGGKTLLAAQAIGVAAASWIEADFPLVLWLVPSTIIRRQTVEALNNPRHAYRAAIDAAFDGRVRVFDIGDFRRVRPQDLAQNLCIVVATIQTLRVEDTEGRKVYAHDENLEAHFAGVGKRTPELETLGAEWAVKTGGDPADIRYSFANLLHLRRPLMIVDEAHKAVTGLSRVMQERVNPIAVVEFTATPHPRSNIVHAVSALEVKDAGMIKLPVRLAEHTTWEGAVTGAIAERAALAVEAANDRDGYIRPIVLFQAEDRNREVTVAVLRQHLIDAHGIDEKRIAVATGDQRGLDKIDLFSPDCPVDFVITVEALKEGWDCSFAYVFCSVANIRSATDAEQLLGRVLRMPYGTRRKAAALNKAYAHLVSRSFAEAATALRDRMVEMGFEEAEATANIEPAQPGLGDGLWGTARRGPPATRIAVTVDAATLGRIASAAPDRVTVTAGDGGAAVITVTGFLRESEKAALFEVLPESAALQVREEIARHEAEHAHTASPAERGEPFVVPRLMAWVQGELALADSEMLAEYFDWSLADHPAQLTAAEFSVVETADTFEIDLSGDRLVVGHADRADQLMFDVAVDAWTEAGLVRLLDRQVRDPGIGQGELITWLAAVVRHLTGPRAIPLATLMRCRFVLARKLKERLAAIRAAERARAYQTCLFAASARPTLSFDAGFAFSDGMFDGVPTYRGAWQFNRHFLGPDRVPAFDGRDDGEEFRCAQALDSIAGVEFWVRNVAGHASAFWLPTATGRTYPDFVAKLTDGRLLVVEYKGGHLLADAAAKRAIGALWQAASEGRGAYTMVERERDGLDMRAQLMAAIG